ncbi:MAG TPA: hypothetical protein VKE40_25245 [Gemmataceae bacterium]|nr:hypothetical protein [Gemmataceae bacterium]
MSRLKGVSPAEAGPFTRLVYWFTRRGIRKITGSSELPEPLTILAHHPKLMKAVARMEMAQASAHAVPARVKSLCGIRTSQLVGCPF